MGLKPGDLGAPYQYRLLRATGQGGTAFTPVASINTALSPTAADTVFVDKGSSASALNTLANAYTYRLEFYYTAPGGAAHPAGCDRSGFLGAAGGQPRPTARSA